MDRNEIREASVAIAVPGFRSAASGLQPATACPHCPHGVVVEQKRGSDHRLKRNPAVRFAVMLFAFANLALPNAHAAQDQLLHLINQYRAGWQNCAGREIAPAPPLQSNTALAAAARAALDGGLLASTCSARDTAPKTRNG